MKHLVSALLGSLLILGMGVSAFPQQVVASSSPSMLMDESGVPIAQERVEYFVTVRDDFGLPSSLADIQPIINEHGVAFEWGFPLTPVELAEMEKRLSLQLELSDEALSEIRSLPGYAGFFFDHENGGAPTVLATDADLIRTRVRDIMPATLKGIVMVVDARRSWAELVGAAESIAGSLDPLLEDQIHRVAISVRANSLKVSILDGARAGEVEEALSLLATVPYILEVEPPSQPDACSSRAVCYSPHKAGVEVWGGGAGSTLGFGINHGGDRQYVMAGHHSAGSYTHYIFTIGSTAENEYANFGIDARAIYAADAQVSDDIFVSSTFSRDVIGTKYPATGMSVCMSGVQTVSCGTVQDDWVLYDASPMCCLLGSAASYSSASGDSGAPVYQMSGSSSAYAVGIHSASNDGGPPRWFARAVDFEPRMGATVLTS